MMGMFKQVRREDMIRFLEYHFALGVNHVVLFDNNCDEGRDGPPTYAATEAMLRPYVDAGLVRLHTEHRCVAMQTFIFKHGFRGGSCMARQLSGMKGVPRGAFVIGIDDDEYIVLRNTSLELSDFAQMMRSSRVCALSMLWRIFGQSGHQCQPDGPLLSQFTRRLPQRHELGPAAVQSVMDEAVTHNLNPPFIGKPVYLYLGPVSPVCATHFCESCPVGYTNCAQEAGPSAEACGRFEQLLHGSAWVNHYAFQSAEHWGLKKVRGRTNQLPTRLGKVPASYDRLEDASGFALLTERLARIEPPPLRVCLEELFEVGRPQGADDGREGGAGAGPRRRRRARRGRGRGQAAAARKVIT